MINEWGAAQLKQAIEPPETKGCLSSCLRTNKEQRQGNNNNTHTHQKNKLNKTPADKDLSGGN